MQCKRSIRVGDQIKKEVSNIILFDLKDPEVGFVTITYVKLTDDLKQARIFFTVLGDQNNIEKTCQALKRAKPFIQQRIGKRVRLKYTPQISFEYDSSVEYGSRIEQLIEMIKHESPREEKKD